MFVLGFACYFNVVGIVALPMEGYAQNIILEREEKYLFNNLKRISRKLLESST